MNEWNALPVEALQRVTGKSKLYGIGVDETVKPNCSHSSLTTVAKDCDEVKILRDNMPFVRPVRQLLYRLCQIARAY